MKKRLFQTCLLVTLFGLLLMTPIVRVSADTEWNLQITNITNTNVTYSYDQLLAMPETNVSASETCYGSLVADGDWSGVSLSYLLLQAGLDSTVASVNFVAQDGYAVSLPLQYALQPDVIIAYQLNGVPLAETLRLVIPEENGNIWIAKITSISMSTATLLSATGFGPGLSPLVGVGVSSNSQNESVQPQPTIQENETSTAPVAPSPSVTQPVQKTAMPQANSPKILGFPVVFVYGIALGATVALAAASYVTYRRIKRRS